MLCHQFGCRSDSTLNAISHLNDIIWRENDRGHLYNRIVGMFTFDVKNAFNTATWPEITEAIMDKRVLPYLSNICICETGVLNFCL